MVDDIERDPDYIRAKQEAEKKDPNYEFKVLLNEIERLAEKAGFPSNHRSDYLSDNELRVRAFASGAELFQLLAAGVDRAADRGPAAVPGQAGADDARAGPHAHRQAGPAGGAPRAGRRQVRRLPPAELNQFGRGVHAGALGGGMRLRDGPPLRFLVA